MDRCNIDEVQLWLACGVRLLPALERQFLNKLAALRHQNKLCLLPQYALQNYSNHIREAL